MSRLPARSLTLELSWLQSQAFRWIERDGWFYGIVKGKLIKVRQSGGGIEFHSDAPEESVRSDVETYFRLDQDIESVHDALRRADNIMGSGTMDRLIDRYVGIRVLRQDPWECLVSYICSQNAGIKSITTMVNKLADRCGDTLTLDVVTCKSFPTPKSLLKAGEAGLEGLGLGLDHARLIVEVARDVTKDKPDLNALADMPYEQARDRLMRYRGIGPKIANCVCLFALDKPGAVPVDRRIAAGLLEHYGKNWIREKNNPVLSLWARQYFDGDARRSSRIDPSRHRAAGVWTRKYFGAHAGYASQLLFLD